MSKLAHIRISMYDATPLRRSVGDQEILVHLYNDISVILLLKTWMTKILRWPAELLRRKADLERLVAIPG